jgi:hypothetical protein
VTTTLAKDETRFAERMARIGVLDMTTTSRAGEAT